MKEHIIEIDDDIIKDKEIQMKNDRGKNVVKVSQDKEAILDLKEENNIEEQEEL